MAGVIWPSALHAILVQLRSFLRLEGVHKILVPYELLLSRPRLLWQAACAQAGTTMRTEWQPVAGLAKMFGGAQNTRRAQDNLRTPGPRRDAVCASVSHPLLAAVLD